MSQPSTHATAFAALQSQLAAAYQKRDMATATKTVQVMLTLHPEDEDTQADHGLINRWQAVSEYQTLQDTVDAQLAGYDLAAAARTLEQMLRIRPDDESAKVDQRFVLHELAEAEYQQKKATISKELKSSRPAAAKALLDELFKQRPSDPDLLGFKLMLTATPRVIPGNADKFIAGCTQFFSVVGMIVGVGVLITYADQVSSTWHALLDHVLAASAQHFLAFYPIPSVLALICGIIAMAIGAMIGSVIGWVFGKIAVAVFGE